MKPDARIYGAGHNGLVGSPLIRKLHAEEYGNRDISMRDVAELSLAAVRCDGELVADTSRSEGRPLKLLQLARIAGMGWSSTLPLHQEGAVTYHQWCRSSVSKSSEAASAR